MKPRWKQEKTRSIGSALRVRDRDDYVFDRQLFSFHLLRKREKRARKFMSLTATYFITYTLSGVCAASSPSGRAFCFSALRFSAADICFATRGVKFATQTLSHRPTYKFYINLQWTTFRQLGKANCGTSGYLAKKFLKIKKIFSSLLLYTRAHARRTVKIKSRQKNLKKTQQSYIYC